MMKIEMYLDEHSTIYVLDCNESNDICEKFKKILAETMRDIGYAFESNSFLIEISKRMGFNVSLLETPKYKYSFCYDEIIEKIYELE